MEKLTPNTTPRKTPRPTETLVDVGDGRTYDWDHFWGVKYWGIGLYMVILYVYIYTVYAIKYDPTIYSKTWLEIFQAEKSHTI